MRWWFCLGGAFGRGLSLLVGLERVSGASGVWCGHGPCGLVPEYGLLTVGRDGKGFRCWLVWILGERQGYFPGAHVTNFES